MSTFVLDTNIISFEMDIFIAAYCQKHNFILVTNNTSHFLPIPDLLLADWTV
jgi:predicted nucleic acid-binding protein